MATTRSTPSPARIAAWSPSSPTSRVATAPMAPALTATHVDDALVLASADGEVSVCVPLDGAPTPSDRVAQDFEVLAPVAVVCALDTALARRLFRRVSAWRPDAHGHLSARVRPTA